MAIETVCYRHKTDGAWRYSALGIGRRPEAAKHGPYFIRIRNAAGKYQWVKHETEAAAKEAAKLAPMAQKAQDLGLTLDDVTKHRECKSHLDQDRDRKLSTRAPFRSPAKYHSIRERIRSVLANRPQGVRFVDQLATPAKLNEYVEFLR